MRKFLIGMLALIVTLAAVPAFAQDGGETQTFVSASTGLTLQLPADWAVQDSPDGVVAITNPAILDDPSVATDDDLYFLATVSSIEDLSDGTAAAVDSIDALRDEVLANTDAAAIIDEYVAELGGKDVFVLIINVESGSGVVYYVLLGDYIAVATAVAPIEATLLAAIPTIDAIVASMTYEAASSSTTTDPAQVGEGVFVYHQSYEQDTVNYTGLGTLEEAFMMPDGTVYVDDGQSLWVLDMATGELGDRILGDSIYALMPDEWAVGPDGELWAWDVLDGLINIDTSLTVSLATGTDFVGESFPDFIAVDAAGNVYVFVPIYDENFDATGTIFIFNSAGELQGSFVTNSENEFGSISFDSFVSIHPQADGTLLLVENQGRFKVVDTAGNVVGAQGKYGDQSDFIVPVAADVAADGTFFALTYDGTLRQYAPSGELVAEVGSEQADDDGPFAFGELPTYGDVIALDSNRALVVGSNFNFSVVTLVDFSRAD